MGVFINELMTLYEAFSRFDSSPLVPLSIQYADYAVWQQKWLKEKVFENQLAYWVERLSESSNLLELPTDRPRPSIQSNRGEQFTFFVAENITRGLKEMSQSEGITIFMTLLASFFILLYRYSNQEDINIGTPIANRNRIEIEKLIGFFINTLVIRSNLSGDPSFREFSHRVHNSALGAYDHQDLPFEILVEKLQLDRDMSFTPLFQVMFVFQNSPMQKRNISGTSMDILSFHSGTSEFDLTLVMSEGPKRLIGSIEFNADLFDLSTIQYFADHFNVLLESIVKNPDQKIAEIPILSNHEKKLIFESWNNSFQLIPLEKTILNLFEEQVALNPDSIAIERKISNGYEKLTYGDLDKKADDLAKYLREFGIGPNQLVGIYMDRSIEMMICLIGIMKAGGAYLPLDPHYPEERLHYMIKNSGVRTIITQYHRNDLLYLKDICVLIYEDKLERISELLNEKILGDYRFASSDDLAYVIYTSGSTGLPKGVMVHHKAVLNHNLYVKKVFNLSNKDRVLQFSTLNFDAAIEEIFPTWLAGATLVLPPENSLTNGLFLISGKDFSKFLKSERITVVDFATAFWNEWIHDLVVGSAEFPSNLRLVVVGGEKVQRDRFDQWISLVDKNVRWLNTYGPTETTVISTLFEPDGDLLPKKDVPIGKPISNTKVYILDDRKNLVPVGVPGELYIGGYGVAKGYINQPDLTQEKFLPDPFNHESKIYRTGDRVKWLSDGNLEYSGRVDDQVKVRGFRIELNEIEICLREHSVIRDAVVITDRVIKDQSSSVNRLIAYLVIKDEMVVTDLEVKNYLRSKLPDYMIPSFFQRIPKFPLLPNGKINKRKLPPPETDLLEKNLGSASHLFPEEEILTLIWEDLLSVKNIDVSDNFFDMGGHSLLVTQLISRIRTYFNVDLSVKSIFEYPTISGQGGLIRKQRLNQPDYVIPKIAIEPIDEKKQLSFAQQRIWFLEQLQPGTPFYNIPAAVHVIGQLDLEVFEECINKIVARHSTLRMTFKKVDGNPVVAIEPELSINIRKIFLREESDDDRNLITKRISFEECQGSFNLEKGPLMRVAVIVFDELNYLIFLTMHHIISDGWSSDIFFREFALLYGEIKYGLVNPLPRLPVQYHDYAAWQRRWLQGDVLKNELSFWGMYLSGAPSLLELPYDKTRPSISSGKGDIEVFNFPDGSVSCLRDICSKEKITSFMLVLAIFNVFLSRYSGQSDICVGIPISNRSNEQIENLIGLFVNTLVIRVAVDNNLHFKKVLDLVKTSTLDAYSHSEVPFEMVVDLLQPERNLSQNPLFQVMFDLIHSNKKVINNFDSELKLIPFETKSGTSKFDLSLTVQEEGDHLIGALEYSTDLFISSSIKRLIDHFLVLFKAILKDLEQPVNKLPLMDANERTLVLYEWNKTEVELPKEQLIHKKFEFQVEKTPLSTAIVCSGAKGNNRYSYKDLNERANSLANYLIQTGNSPKNIIGIFLNRSFDMIVALLGVLKAGSIFLPLDPFYPEDRLSYMVQDSKVKIILTQKEFEKKVSSYGTDLLFLDSDWGKVESSNKDYEGRSEFSNISPEDTAYVMYTSGSTGQPKGVMVPHRAVVNHNLAVIEAFKLTSEDRILQFATINFDTSIEEIFPTLLSGAILIIPPGEYIINGSFLVSGSILFDLVRTERITVLDLPTAYWHSLVVEIKENQIPIPESLRLVIVGGEKVERTRYDDWIQLGTKHIQWMNTYGPTEGTIIATLFNDKETLEIGADIPIGKPLNNVKIYILDPNYEPTPIGVPGSLYIGGKGVTKGYLNLPDLTSQKFISDPFNPGEFIYQTGDRAYWQRDGNIIFCGREDNQIKIRGFRVELGEIETVLIRHPRVKECVVIAFEESNITGVKNKRLVAYIIPDGQKPEADELKEFIASELPEYMVPSSYLLIDKIPLSLNGKINKKALPEPEIGTIKGSEYVLPITDVEEKLAQIWGEVLGLEKVSVNESFFELGGDSILSIQAVARANQRGIIISVREMFEAQTIKRLAQLVKLETKVDEEQGLILGFVELTPVQRWFFDQNYPESWHWNQALLLEVKEEIDELYFLQAVNDLLIHHDVLRMKFQKKEGKNWRGFIEEKASSQFVEFIDLAGNTIVEFQNQIEDHSTYIQSSLDLELGPLVRFVFYRGRNEFGGRLLIVIHHLLIDNVSWQILIEDLWAGYVQARQGNDIIFPPKTSSFQKWANQLVEFGNGNELTEEIHYWEKILKGPHTPLVAEYIPELNTEESVENIHLTLNEEDTKVLLVVAPKVLGTEINDILLTGLGYSLFLWTGIHSWLVALEGHGREEIFTNINITRTIGWFTSVFPIRLEVPNTANLLDSLKIIKEGLHSIPLKGIGFGILRYLNPRFSTYLSSFPFPEISFNYLGQVDRQIENRPITIANEKIGFSRSKRAPREFILDVTCGIIGGKLDIEISYSNNFHENESISSLIGYYTQSLNEITEMCLSPQKNTYTPSDFNLIELDQVKLEKILSKVNPKIRTNQ